MACVVTRYISFPGSCRKYAHTVATVKVSFMRFPYLSETY
nr:MAG TPA: hypothetical protein [Caudoviricetes sp.]